MPRHHRRAGPALHGVDRPADGGRHSPGKGQRRGRLHPQPGGRCSGLCYCVTEADAEMENPYAYFARGEVEAVAAAVMAGYHAPAAEAELDALVPEWLNDCCNIVVAAKRQYDGLYWSRVTPGQLCRFLLL